MPHQEQDGTIQSREPLPGLANAYDAPQGTRRYHLADGVALASSDPLQDGYGVGDVRYWAPSVITVPEGVVEFIEIEPTEQKKHVRILDYRIDLTRAASDPDPTNISFRVVPEREPGTPLQLADWNLINGELVSSITPGAETAETTFQGMVFRPHEHAQLVVLPPFGVTEVEVDLQFRYVEVPSRVKPPTR